jgi:glutathione S-transferase
MRLYGSKTSPYVRKVRVVLAELDLADRVEVEMLDPHAAPPELVAVNPLSKVPTLVTNEGEVLQDSAVIAEYLDATLGGNRLLPADGARRWTVLRNQSLADGMLDAAVLVRMENQRPEGERSPAWIDKQLGKVHRALDLLDSDSQWRTGTLDLGVIATACAVGWIEFRMPEVLAFERRPGLGEWYRRFAERPSMQATRPG